MTSFEQNREFIVKALTTPKKTRDEFRRLVKESKKIWLAYAWARGDAQWKLLERHTQKIQKAVLGASFYHTDPTFLRNLAERGCLRVSRLPSGNSGVFHPKLIVGKGEQGWSAIVGSSNLTEGGYSEGNKNVEVNVLISHHSRHEEIGKLVEFIEEQAKEVNSYVPDEAWLDDYQVKFEAPPPETHKHPEPTSKANIISESELHCDWATYIAKLQRQQSLAGSPDKTSHVIDGQRNSYMGEIEACQRIFAKDVPFHLLDEADQKVVAGLGASTGHLGRMSGAAAFKAVFRKDPAKFGAVLDDIPRHERVTLDQARQWLSSLIAIRGLGIATSTRLLSVKRPDLFLPANDKSFDSQQSIFGSKPNSEKKYIAMIEAIWETPWFKSAKPEDAHERKLWGARVALLDALFYQP